MDGFDSAFGTLDGFAPVSILEIECVSNVAGEQASTIRTIFRSIARLTDDSEIKGLCEHGSLQAEMLAGDLDAFRGQAMRAALADTGIKTYNC